MVVYTFFGDAFWMWMVCNMSIPIWIKYYILFPSSIKLKKNNATDAIYLKFQQDCQMIRSFFHQALTLERIMSLMQYIWNSNNIGRWSDLSSTNNFFLLPDLIEQEKLEIVSQRLVINIWYKAVRRFNKKSTERMNIIIAN